MHSPLRYFILYLVSLSVMTLLSSYGFYFSLSVTCASSNLDSSLMVRLVQMANCNPWVFFNLCNAVVHAIWGTGLAVCQLYQTIYLAMTTNERLMSSKYAHFRDQQGRFRLAFSRGACRNFVDFFNCHCCGLFRPRRDDTWFNTFSYDNDAGNDGRDEAVTLV